MFLLAEMWKMCWIVMRFVRKWSAKVVWMHSTVVLRNVQDIHIHQFRMRMITLWVARQTMKLKAIFNHRQKTMHLRRSPIPQPLLPPPAGVPFGDIGEVDRAQLLGYDTIKYLKNRFKLHSYHQLAVRKKASSNFRCHGWKNTHDWYIRRLRTEAIVYHVCSLLRMLAAEG